MPYDSDSSGMSAGDLGESPLSAPAELCRARVPSLDSHPYVVLTMASLDAATTDAEPPWPTVPHASIRDWCRFERYPNNWAACIIAGLLENEGVPTIIESS